MAVQEASDVEADEQYHDLSPKRKEIVDAWAELYNEEGDEPKNVDVVDRADANESYVSQTLSEYQHIAEARADILANQRDEGQEETTGDPFQGQIPDESSGFQTIQERPNKGTTQTTTESVDESSQPQSTQTDDSGYTYNLSPSEIETIVVDQELPESLHSELQREVIQRAFGN